MYAVWVDISGIQDVLGLVLRNERPTGPMPLPLPFPPERASTAHPGTSLAPCSKDPHVNDLGNSKIRRN